eukprot:746504-Hanusia_phi.AAC.4
MESESSIQAVKEAYFLTDLEVANGVHYDVDRSSDIDADEIARVLEDLGLHLDETEVSDILAEVDVDGSGSVGLDEYISLLSDPDGPLAEALKHQSHKSFVDPRQVEGWWKVLLGSECCAGEIEAKIPGNKMEKELESYQSSRKLHHPIETES